MREYVLAAIAENPVVGSVSPDVLERMKDPVQDCTFEELGFSSLALMEFCIVLEADYAICITQGDLETHTSINTVAAWLANSNA